MQQCCAVVDNVITFVYSCGSQMAGPSSQSAAEA